MEFIKIEIDLDVHKFIEAKRSFFEQSPNDILRELLEIDEPTERHPHKMNSLQHYWVVQNVRMPVGTILRAEHEGIEYQGEVEPHGLKVDGAVYRYLSSAARSITGKNTNGWKFWQYLDPELDRWRLVDRLRW